MAEQYRPFSGARAKLFFEGNLEGGWATNVRGQERINNVRVDVMGDAFTQEIEPTGVSVTFSASFVRILKRSLRKMGIWLPNATTEDVINWPAMTVEVYDKVGKTPIYRILGAKPASRNFSGDKAGLFSEECEWEAIKLVDVEQG